MGAFLGPIRTNSSAPYSQREGAEIAPKRDLFGLEGVFWGKPPFAKPPFRFPLRFSQESGSKKRGFSFLQKPVSP